MRMLINYLDWSHNMKKITTLLLVLLLGFVLVACDAINEYVESVRPEVFAPEVTLAEAEFMAMIDILDDASVAISNQRMFDSTFEDRKASGVVVKKTTGQLNQTYYALTSDYAVKDSLTVTVFVSPTESVTGNVLNPDSLIYESSIKVISFQTNKALEVVELKSFDEDILSLKSRTIFSIATPISNAYYNIVTNPASIMGIQGEMIIHGTNLNQGTLGSPLYLKETGELIGINVKYSTTAGGRPEVLINEALFINHVIEIVESFL